MSGVRTFHPNQERAIDTASNAVVSAGAGSGKTAVLVERFARLIELRGLPIDSILALTFTRKAAAEMNQRGLRSPAFTAARLMPEEYEINRFHRWVLAEMEPMA
ncbi:MAG: UvrD-helicase domain-containing protein [Rhodospirillales bacterium]|nr:UvrD-helicase domain-containing protein [Rhodospirillales bacterium]